MAHFERIGHPDRHSKSATNSRAGGMRMVPGRSLGHLCKWPLICHNVLDLILEIVTEMLILICLGKCNI